MDSDRARLRGIIRLPRRGMVVTLHKVAFSSCKAALASKKETNYCWWDSCSSYSSCSSDSNRCSHVGSELERGISPIRFFRRRFTVIFSVV